MNINLPSVFAGAIILIGAVGIITVCLSTTPKIFAPACDMRQLQKGMTKDQLIAQCGKPRSIKHTVLGGEDDAQ